MNKIVIEIEELKPKEIAELIKFLERGKYPCYQEDKRGNTFPLTRRDFKKIFIDELKGGEA